MRATSRGRSPSAWACRSARRTPSPASEPRPGRGRRPCRVPHHHPQGLAGRHRCGRDRRRAYFVPRKRPIRVTLRLRLRCTRCSPGRPDRNGQTGCSWCARVPGGSTTCRSLRHRPGPADPRCNSGGSTITVAGEIRRPCDSSPPWTGSRSTPRWRHRAAPGSGGLDPHLSGALSRVVRGAAAGRARARGRPRTPSRRCRRPSRPCGCCSP